MFKYMALQGFTQQIHKNLAKALNQLSLYLDYIET